MTYLGHERLDTTVTTIPAEVPYLQADTSLAQAWRERMDSDRYNVGIVWAGKVIPIRADPAH